MKNPPHVKKINNRPLKHRLANRSIALASSDQSLTTIQLCSIDSHVVVSDFHHFQAHFVDSELAIFKQCDWGTCNSDILPGDEAESVGHP